MNIEQKRQVLLQAIQSLSPETLETWIEDNLDLYEVVYNAEHPDAEADGFVCGFDEEEDEIEDEEEEDALEDEEEEDEESLDHDDDFGADNVQDW